MNKPKCCQKMPYVQKGKIKKYAWCGCKVTSNAPLCDGTHSKL